MVGGVRGDIIPGIDMDITTVTDTDTEEDIIMDIVEVQPQEGIIMCIVTVQPV